MPIKDVAWPYLKYLGADYDSITIGYPMKGVFNRVFIIHTTDRVTKEARDYIFRVARPVDPYYKTESDVATTRHSRAYQCCTGGREDLMMSKNTAF